MNDQSPDGYHAHVYYDSRGKAEQLAEALTDPLTDDSVREDDTDGAWLGTPLPLKLQILSRAYRPELLPSA
jgi:aromatic ring-cleaving dioxygenase